MVCQTGVKRQSWNLRYVEKQRVLESNDQTTAVPSIMVLLKFHKPLYTPMFQRNNEKGSHQNYALYSYILVL